MEEKDKKSDVKYVSSCRLLPIVDNRRKRISYNPVEEHLFMLRECSVELNVLIRKAEEELEKWFEVTTEEDRCAELPSYSIPKFPENYPFSDSSDVFSKKRRETRIKFKGTLQSKQVRELTENFVRRVLVETGCSGVSSEMSDFDPLEYLVDLTDLFLKAFVDVLKRNKNSEVFCKTDDLWGPLETTLREMRVDGINGLHKFYYENIVRKHDILLSQCIENLGNYEKLRAACIEINERISATTSLFEQMNNDGQVCTVIPITDSEQLSAIIDAQDLTAVPEFPLFYNPLSK